MALRINDIAPDFDAETTEGPIRFHDWVGEGYAILFSHPKDFTPVCTTEFMALSERAAQFAELDTRLIGLSVDPIEDHLVWKADIERLSGRPLGFPIIADPGLEISRAWDMLPAESYVLADGEIADPITQRKTLVLKGLDGDIHLYADTSTVRGTYIIGPDKRIRVSQTYPNSVGRNFDETLRALLAIRATDGVPLNTPAQWQPGGDMIVSPLLPTEDARRSYGDVTEYTPYYRTVKAPR